MKKLLVSSLFLGLTLSAFAMEKADPTRITTGDVQGQPTFTSMDAPANDLCENAQFVTGPYPVQIMGTLAEATVDCPGLLDWNAIWYEIDLPYGLNTVTVDWCDDMEAWDNYGIILMDDCACDDYILGSYAWTCPNGNLELVFAGVAGPGTILFPHFVQDYDEMVETFVININVEDGTPTELGDSCGLPYQIPGLPYNYVGTTVDNSDTYGNASADEWFAFTGCDGEFRITLCDGATGFDTYIRLLTGDCSTEIASNDDFCGLVSEMNVTLYDGTFVICVEGYSSSAGDYTLDVTGPDCVPPGDFCVTPFVAAALPYHFGGTTTDNTDTYGNSSPDEWHRFTLAEDATSCRITLCDGATDFDTYIRLFDGDCATELASNDDFCGMISEMNFSPMPAGIYVVCVEGYSSGAGYYDLDITAEFAPPPAGDTCADPIIVPGLPFDVYETTLDNNDTYGNPSADEWYQFEVVDAGLYCIDLCDAFTDYDTYLRLFSDCETEIAYDDDGLYGSCPESPAPYTPSYIEIALDPGTYTVCVEGYSSNNGGYGLHIWNCTITDIDVPETTYLANNYPNPFNPSTTIEFGLNVAGNVEIAVYDVTGRMVATLQNGLMTAGNHTMEWAPSADMASGIYFLRMTATDFSQVQKMTFVK
jgi:hypothetical protein